MKNTIVGLVCLVLVAFGLGTWTAIALQNHDSHDLTVSKESAAMTGQRQEPFGLNGLEGL